MKNRLKMSHIGQRFMLGSLFIEQIAATFSSPNLLSYRAKSAKNWALPAKKTQLGITQDYAKIPLIDLPSEKNHRDIAYQISLPKSPTAAAGG